MPIIRTDAKGNMTGITLRGAKYDLGNRNTAKEQVIKHARDRAYQSQPITRKSTPTITVQNGVTTTSGVSVVNGGGSTSGVTSTSGFNSGLSSGTSARSNGLGGSTTVGRGAGIPPSVRGGAAASAVVLLGGAIANGLSGGNGFSWERFRDSIIPNPRKNYEEWKRLLDPPPSNTNIPPEIRSRSGGPSTDPPVFEFSPVDQPFFFDIEMTATLELRSGSEPGAPIFQSSPNVPLTIPSPLRLYAIPLRIYYELIDYGTRLYGYPPNQFPWHEKMYHYILEYRDQQESIIKVTLTRLEDNVSRSFSALSVRVNGSPVSSSASARSGTSEWTPPPPTVIVAPPPPSTRRIAPPPSTDIEPPPSTRRIAPPPPTVQPTPNPPPTVFAPPPGFRVGTEGETRTGTEGGTRTGTGTRSGTGTERGTRTETRLEPGWSAENRRQLQGFTGSIPDIRMAPVNGKTSFVERITTGSGTQSRVGTGSERVTTNLTDGKSGKISQEKINEVERRETKQVEPDKSPPELCQNPCIADIQRGQRNNNEMTTITFDRFLTWNPVFGKAIFVPEKMQVPANMAPFARMVGNRTADIRSRFGLAELRARLTQVMNVLSTAATLHNAAMLSANLGQTLGDVVTNSVQTFAPMFGVDKELAETFDFNEVLGNAVNTTMENALGKETWNGTKTTFTKLNRIVTTASNIIWTVRSISDSAREVAEWTAENTGKIGNALKRFRVVGENAYSWMPERVTAQGRWARQVQRYRDGVGSIDDAASSLSGAVSEVRSGAEEIAELKEQKEAFEKAIKEESPNNRPDNDPTKKAADLADQMSKSPNLSVSDREKGDAP